MLFRSALSQALGDLCARLGVPWLPLFEAVSASPAWRAEAAAGDGSHPGAGGYAALADHLLGQAAFRAWLGLPAASVDR